MSNPEHAPEPTMDEILASIRRIIADDYMSPGDSRPAGQSSAQSSGQPAGQSSGQSGRGSDGGARSQAMAQPPVNGSASGESADDILDLTHNLIAQRMARVTTPSSVEAAAAQDAEAARAAGQMLGSNVVQGPRPAQQPPAMPQEPPSNREPASPPDWARRDSSRDMPPVLPNGAASQQSSPGNRPMPSFSQPPMDQPWPPQHGAPQGMPGQWPQQALGPDGRPLHAGFGQPYPHYGYAPYYPPYPAYPYGQPYPGGWPQAAQPQQPPRGASAHSSYEGMPFVSPSRAIMREELAPVSMEAAPEFMSSAVASTVEDSLREMLRPMLRQWLEQNMHKMLESAMREEMASMNKRGFKGSTGT